MMVFYRGMLATLLIVGSCVGSVETLGKWPEVAPAQAASRAPAFEVASVKPNMSGTGV